MICRARKRDTALLRDEGRAAFGWHGDIPLDTQPVSPKLRAGLWGKKKKAADNGCTRGTPEGSSMHQLPAAFVTVHSGWDRPIRTGANLATSRREMTVKEPCFENVLELSQLKS